MESPDLSSSIADADVAGPMATTACPRCQRPLAAPPELAGLVVECAHCRFRFVAPELEFEVAAAPARPPMKDSPTRAAETRIAPPRPQTLAILLGSACGLIVGYYVLNFLWGSQFDLLRIPLPGVAHTQQRSAPAAEAIAEEEELASPAAAPIAQGPIVQAIATESLVTSDAKTSQTTSDAEPGKLPEMTAARPLATGKPLAGGPPVRGAKLVSADRLKATLTEAERMSACRRCNATGRIQRTSVSVSKRGAKGKPVETTAVCDECGGLAAAQLSPEIYQVLCEAAEAACFVEVRDADGALEEERRKLQALLLRVAASREKSNDLGRMASLWLDNSQRRGVGIALAGTVQRASREGKLWRYDVLVFGRPRVVTVLAPRDGGLREKDRVAVLGAVVDHPRYNLTGYTGDATQIVWGGLPLKLPEE